MKNYEIMTIYKSNLGDQAAKDLSTKVQEAVTVLGGTISKANFWGKRKFAYELDKEKEGYYDVVNFELDPASMAKLKTKLKLLDGLVRYLITA